MNRMNRAAVWAWAALGFALPALVPGPAPGQPPEAPARKTFHDSVTPLPPEPGIGALGLIRHAMMPQHRNDTMELLFALDIPPAAEEELEARVAKGEVVPPQEVDEKYSPKPAAAEALVKWLKDQGFQVTSVSPNRSGVYARGTVAQIEKNLQVRMVRVTRDGVTYNAAATAPSLPAEVGAGVHAIIGLQPFRQAHKQSRWFVPPKAGPAPARLGLAAAGGEPAAPQPQPNVRNAPPYLVKEILRAYNGLGLNLTGKGQKIAILIDTFPVDSDLQGFWQRNGLPVGVGQVEKVNVGGGPLPGQEGEETLDVEWTSGIAPGATIRVYASGSLSFVDLDLALDRIITDTRTEPGMRQLSISLGLGETYLGGPQGEVRTQHRKFLRLAAAGVNTFVSSGDAGSRPDDTGHGSAGPKQAEYEASDSCVIGVGGTTLDLHGSGGAAPTETAWAGSGGGTSVFFKRPPWQTGAGLPHGTMRCVPDVCLAADPDTGAFVYFQGQAQQIGGTSWSAPMMAGICALANEARANGNKPALAFLGPKLYPLLGTACFRDVTAGSNGDYHAQQGYDQVTGLGSPNITELIKALSK